MKPNANPFRGVVLLICVLALIFCATSIFRTTTHQTTYSYADIRDLFQQEKVETVQVDEDTLTLTLKEPVNGNNVVTYSIYSFQLFYDDFNDIVVRQYEDGIISDYDYPDSPPPGLDEHHPHLGDHPGGHVPADVLPLLPPGPGRRGRRPLGGPVRQGPGPHPG